MMLLIVKKWTKMRF